MAGLLRSRWTQENFFKYMRSEFGLDTLAEHALAEVAPDTRVTNPPWRVAGNLREKTEERLGRLRRRLAREEHPDSERGRRLQAQPAAADRLEKGLAWGMSDCRQHVPAGELDPEDRVTALPAPLRHLLETVRVAACRAEPAMAAVVAPEPAEPARELLQALFRSAAGLRPDPAAGTLAVSLLHQSTRARDEALGPLTADLNRARAVFPGTDLRLVYEILPTAPTRPAGAWRGRPAPGARLLGRSAGSAGLPGGPAAAADRVPSQPRPTATGSARSVRGRGRRRPSPEVTGPLPVPVPAGWPAQLPATPLSRSNVPVPRPRSMPPRLLAPRPSASPCGQPIAPATPSRSPPTRDSWTT